MIYAKMFKGAMGDGVAFLASPLYLGTGFNYETPLTLNLVVSV